MSDVTPHLGLPLIAAGQAQKHVTHNEAISQLDALVQLACLDKDLAAPPANPAEGDRYLITASSPPGAWAGLSGQVVRFADGAWAGVTPAAGWLAYLLDEKELYVFDGQAWLILRTAPAATSSDRLGVNTQADATNRLAVKSNAVLLAWDDVTPGTGDMRVTLNKKEAGWDAGFVFQTGWSSRALFGTLGGDDFVLKTSPDGATFITALTAAGATGVVSFGASPKAPTPPASDNSTQLATTAYVDRAISASGGGAGSGGSVAPAAARTEVSGASYTILASDRTVAIIALTGPCSLTLPAASAFPQGALLTVVDESGACSAAKPITIARAGSATINGLASAAIVTPYGYLAFQSNGSGRWTVVNRTPLLNRATFVNVAVTDGKQRIGDSFGRITLPTTLSDTGGNWDPTNNTYRVPRDGIYQITGSLRVADNTAAGTQYGVGVHINEEDGPFFLWHAVGASPSTRSTYPYSRLYEGREGQLLRMIAYAGTSTTIMAAGLQICLIADAA
jgi:hypothetical protein